MKITNISCTQFAGMRNCDVSFTDGINIVCGPNESGKSTIVNLLSRTLFQKVKIDARSDKDFKNNYFPSKLKGGKNSGDFIDGKVTFETKNGTYILSKEWGKDGRCRLETSDGIISSIDSINEILKDELVYGEGVYNEMLFSSQKNSDMTLQTLLDVSKKTDAKKEIADTVSKAFVQSDNVSIDAIEAAIAEKISIIEGEHWDFEQCMPARKSTGRWAKGLGEILKAYYALQDIKDKCNEIVRLENEADMANADYNEKEKLYSAAEEKYNSFQSFAIRLAERNANRTAIKNLKELLLKFNRIIAQWPVMEAELEKAKALKKELTLCNITMQYENAKSVNDMIVKLSKELDSIGDVDSVDLDRLKKAVRQIDSLSNKLCGMNLLAQIKLKKGHNMTVTSVRTGEEIAFDDNLSITEAVDIKIADVMEMRLSPADVNVDEINKSISDLSNLRDEIYRKYNINSVDELEQKINLYNENKQKVINLNTKLDIMLDGKSFDELKAEFDGIETMPRSKTEICDDIMSLCKSPLLDKFIAEKEAVTLSYKSEYTSVDMLKAKAFDAVQELQAAEGKTTDSGDIPEEFASVSRPEEYLEMLKNDVRDKQLEKDKAFSAKSNAQSRLEAYRESLDGEVREELEATERKFNEQKENLSHWKHIEQVFYRRKELLDSNPMQDIADSFTKYLDLISGGKVTSEFPEGDKLKFDIYSNEHTLDYEKLSEGTKETILLAFRLAVFEHLYPDGGGIAVFDDPFTDMDEERTMQSIKLIKEFAKRHQVIFLTCREEYIDKLKGNVIKF